MTEAVLYIDHVYRDWWRVSDKLDAPGVSTRLRSEAVEIANNGVRLVKHGLGYRVEWCDGVLEKLQSLVAEVKS